MFPQDLESGQLAPQTVTAPSAGLEQRHRPTAALVEIVPDRGAGDGFTKDRLDATVYILHTQLRVSPSQNLPDRLANRCKLAPALRARAIG